MFERHVPQIMQRVCVCVCVCVCARKLLSIIWMYCDSYSVRTIPEAHEIRYMYIHVVYQTRTTIARVCAVGYGGELPIYRITVLQLQLHCK